ncbi:MAG: DUF1573 domain-containing protein [Bacteroidota bacterium]
MKQFLILFTAIVFTHACNNGQPGDENRLKKPKITFENTTYDFGTIPYDGYGRCYFEFVNTSDHELIVNEVKTTCGCTRPEWPEEPIKPGENGRIGISYNTKITGRFQKSIMVYSNAKNSPVKLYIKGNVKKETN